MKPPATQKCAFTPFMVVSPAQQVSSPIIQPLPPTIRASMPPGSLPPSLNTWVVLGYRVDALLVVRAPRQPQRVVPPPGRLLPSLPPHAASQSRQSTIGSYAHAASQSRQSTIGSSTPHRAGRPCSISSGGAPLSRELNKIPSAASGISANATRPPAKLNLFD